MRRRLAALAVLAMGAALLVVAGGSQAADHLDAPFVQRDGRLDINDVYVFGSDDDTVTMIMTVNPGAGVLSPTSLKKRAAYQFLVDTDGNGIQDDVLTFFFGKVRPNGTQRFKLYHNREVVGVGRTGTKMHVGDARVAIRTFDDPFFFDLAAFRDTVGLTNTGRAFCDGMETDFFAGLNVTGIVLEVPSSWFGQDNLGVWGRTKTGGTLIDTMGRPAINTVLIPSDGKDQFNNTKPRDQHTLFGQDVVDTLLGLSGLDGTPYSQAEAEAIAAVLLPDINTVDVTDNAGFLNGRRLADDVIDAELGVVTGGFFGGSPVLTTDCVDANDLPFRNRFPYLAAPHTS